MTQTDTNATGASDKGKGKAFFDRADQVAETSNWDFAIQLYLEGIAREPSSIERGHEPLRKIALMRKSQGGKGPGMLEPMKYGPKKDPVQSLTNAEYLLAKDPGNQSYMVQVLKASEAVGVASVTKWIAHLLLEAQKVAKKRDRRILVLLTDAYTKIEEYASALMACEMALQLAPDDGALQSRRNDLSAKETIQRGQYDNANVDFTHKVADIKKQQELMEKDALAKGHAHLQEQVEKARGEYLAAPLVPGKINALVDALMELEDESFENEAIDVLTKAHKDTSSYQFKMKIGDIKIKQMTRRYRKLLETGDKAAALEQAKRQVEFELEEYTERAVNYPTDLSIKFELGRRQFLAGHHDDAIASLQQAQRDPRRHVRSLLMLGQAFTKKEWYHEAVETFSRCLESEMTEERSKEVRYHLADVLEKLGKFAEAQEHYSAVAQMDYNYKDVRERLDIIRKKVNDARAQGE